MLRILSDGDIDSVLIKDRCGDDFTWAVRVWIFDRLIVFGFIFIGNTIETPDLRQNVKVILSFDWGGSKGLANTVTRSEKHQFLTVDVATGRG